MFVSISVIVISTYLCKAIRVRLAVFAYKLDAGIVYVAMDGF